MEARAKLKSMALHIKVNDLRDHRSVLDEVVLGLTLKTVDVRLYVVLGPK